MIYLIVWTMEVCRPITIEDAQIAAIALAGGLRLATGYEQDFADIPGLVVVNPWTMG